MTRLIPGRDAPEVESSQVTGQASPLVAALVLAVVNALEDWADPRDAESKVSLRAVPDSGGANLEDVEAGPALWVREPTLGTAGSRERGALVPLSWGDTPGSRRPIGGIPSPHGPGGRARPVAEADGAGPALPPPRRHGIRAVPDPESTDRLEPVLTEAAEAADVASGLWADYGAGRSQGSRDRLVVHYRGLVQAVAGKLVGGLPAHVEMADLVQVGMFGLLDAVERFDPEREVRFESFAAQRIRGAMLDELRAQDWVPRGARARRREVERTRERLEGTRGRSVSDGEVAAELGIALRELRGALQHRRLVSVEAVQAAISGPVTLAELVPDHSAPDPVEVAEHAETVRELVLAVAGLEERDRQVVRLYYLENRTLAEVGRLLGVTESRACQLHSRLVTRLRGRLAASEAG